jgi:3-hydroxyisobutyrate dehydrogenase-like beta-hydroxyacid dehydrogenase
MSAKLGFVGLGKMGAPMARNLMKAGHDLVITSANPASLGEFADLGAKVVDRPVSVADECETVFASLPTPPIVEAVALGEGGVSSGKAVKRFVDLSTTGAACSVRIAGRLAEMGIAHLDAPVSGGRAGAAAGTLAVIVSGPRAHFLQLEPIFRQLGRPYFVGEKPGLGQTMKLVNNLLAATAMAATSEAVVMAVKAGIDPSVAVDVINAGTGRTGASADKFPNAVIPRTFNAGFTTGLMYKDVRLCIEEAEAMGVQMWIGNSVKQMWQLADTQIGPSSDFTRIVELSEGWAKVTVGSGT